MLKNTITQQTKQWLMLAGLFSVAFLSTKTLANALPQEDLIGESEELIENNSSKLKALLNDISGVLKIGVSAGLQDTSSGSIKSLIIVPGIRKQLTRRLNVSLGAGIKLEKSIFNALLTGNIGYLILETLEGYAGLNIQFHDIFNKFTNVSVRPHFGLSNSYRINDYLVGRIYGDIEIFANSTLLEKNSKLLSTEERAKLEEQVRVALKFHLEQIIPAASTLETPESVKKYSEDVAKKSDEIMAKAKNRVIDMYRTNLGPSSGEELRKQYFERAVANAILNGTKQIIGEINNTMQQVATSYDGPANSAENSNKPIEALENIWITVIQLYENIETDKYLTNISMTPQFKKSKFATNSIKNILKHVEFHIGISLEVNNNNQEDIAAEELETEEELL